MVFVDFLRLAEPNHASDIRKTASEPKAAAGRSSVSLLCSAS